jgi:WD40 repeat protein
VWNVQTGAELFTLKGHTGLVFSVAFSPDGKRLATGAGIGDGGQGGELKVWDARTGQELLTLDGISGLSNGVAFNPDGRRLVGRGRDRTVKIWDATPLPEKWRCSQSSAKRDQAAGEDSPPSRSLTGPASPRRSACPPGAMTFLL